MANGRRVKRLQELIAEIELLPPSPDRDRLLSEFRSRAVDLDTGVTPRAMLPIRVIPETRTPRENTARVAPPAPPSPPAPATEVVPPSRVHEVKEQFALDERLTLDDAPRPPVRTRGDGALAPWTLGLRG
jgi:hypothetical protein